MRKLSLVPEAFRVAADLARLPMLDRDLVQRDPEYFLSNSVRVDDCLRLRSGGSTGVPLVNFHDARSIVEGAGHFERQRSVMTKLAGTRFSSREAVIVPPLSTFAAKHEYLQARRLVRSAALGDLRYFSLLDPPERNLALIDDFKPEVVQGYGSYLESLYRHAHSTGEAFHRPRLVVYYSDEMSEPGRRLLSQTLGIPVVSIYGANEAFHVGFECERGTGYHLNVDLVATRIVDGQGREVAEGESGEVVVSNLVNRATVLLNYRLGDIASVRPSRCPCGRSLPMLSFIEGRTDEWIVSESGRMLHPEAVRKLFTDEEEIWQHQIAQVTRSHFQVTVVADPRSDRQAMQARLAEKFAGRLGAGTTISLSFVESIPRTEGGKLRAVLGMDATPEVTLDAR